MNTTRTIVSMAKFLTVGVATGEKAQNAEFFGTDLSPRSDNEDVALKWTVTTIGDNVLLQITFDSGSTWSTLGTPTAATLTTYSFNTRIGDTINFRTNDAGGFTTVIFRVDAEIL